jgi:DNA-binding MarR family transcriptional regulator
MPTSTLQTEAARALARLARLIERTAGRGGLSLAHYRMLAAVASGDERASRLATRLALGKPAISAAVDALCRRGLLLRADVEQDQRATALRLTADGVVALAATEGTIIRMLDDVAARTPDAAQVLQTLAWLGRAMDQIASERSASQPPASQPTDGR